jgi:hypothetical protein
MDGTRFDQLIKQLGTARVSRLTALRGLATGAVASVTGLSLFGEDGEAKKDGKKTRKRRICHRTSASDPGVNKKLKAKRAKRHLKKHPFDTKGRCTAPLTPLTPTTAAPAPPGFNCVNAGCVGQNAGLVCDTATGQCVNCTSFAQCPEGTFCGAGGRCRGLEQCVNDAQCFGIVPPGIEQADCNVNGNDNAEAPDDVCILNPFDYELDMGSARLCDEDEDCESIDTDFDFECVTNVCVQACPGGQDDCDDFSATFFNAACLAGLCFDQD